MNGLVHARASIDAQLVTYRAERGPVTVEQVDADLCEDERTVMFTAHLSDGNAVAASVDLPKRVDPGQFDPEAWRDAMRDCPPTTVH